MVSNQGSGKPTTRRYSPEAKAAAVRMVRTLRAELGTEYGTVHRVASQLGYGRLTKPSSVRGGMRSVKPRQGSIGSPFRRGRPEPRSGVDPKREQQRGAGSRLRTCATPGPPTYVPNGMLHAWQRAPCIVSWPLK